MSLSDNALALSLPDELGSLTRASELRTAEAGVSAWRLGWPALDALLGGVPWGQVTEWAGPRSAGKTAALRQLVRAVRNAGAGATYVDGTGTLTPTPWVLGRLGPNGAAPFWVVRPPKPDGVLAAADELVRSGAFGLVIAEGGGRGGGGGGGDGPRAQVVRLQRLARETGAALVAVVERPGSVPLAGFRVQFSAGADPRSCFVRVRGRGRAHPLSCVNELPYRLPADSGLPDRRGTQD